MEENIKNVASKKRLFLSWYIDLLFFLTIWGLLSYFLKFGESIPFWLPYIIFVVLRLALTKLIGSIGYTFLSIDKSSMRVSENILANESWLTILLGVVFILEGTKQVVRWTQLFVPQPAFGFFPDETTQIIIHIVFGTLSIFAGYWFLKLDIKGLILSVLIAITNLISQFLSWDLWDPVVEEMVIKRREFQGMPIRDGEIEVMQSLMPEGIVVIAIVSIIAMAITYPRFKHA